MLVDKDIQVRYIDLFEYTSLDDKLLCENVLSELLYKDFF